MSRSCLPVTIANSDHNIEAYLDLDLCPVPYLACVCTISSFFAEWQTFEILGTISTYAELSHKHKIQAEQNFSSKNRHTWTHQDDDNFYSSTVAVPAEQVSSTKRHYRLHAHEKRRSCGIWVTSSVTNTIWRGQREDNVSWSTYPSRPRRQPK